MLRLYWQDLQLISVQLFSVRSVLGIGEAGYAPASLSLLGDFFSKEKRGRILSYWSSGTLLGAAIGFALGGLVADAFGWRYAFFLVGIPGLIAAFLAWRMLEPKRGAFESSEGSEPIRQRSGTWKYRKRFPGLIENTAPHSNVLDTSSSTCV